jgi:hypothetical protein
MKIHSVTAPILQLYVLDSGIPIISVCAWCYPGRSFFDKNPELEKQFRLSHGICQEHFMEMVRDYENRN